MTKEKYLVVTLFGLGLAIHLWGLDHPLDTRLFYSSQQADTFLRGLSAAQVQTYILHESIDLIFIATYSKLFYLLARRFYFQKAWLAFIPGVFDLVETIAIILLLINKLWVAPIWLGYLTCLKWATGSIVVVSIIAEFAHRRP